MYADGVLYLSSCYLAFYVTSLRFFNYLARVKRSEWKLLFHEARYILTTDLVTDLGVINPQRGFFDSAFHLHPLHIWTKLYLDLGLLFVNASPPGSLVRYSSIHFTQSHSPFKFSFHKLTLLSPPLTASTFPLRLQLTLHNTASKFNVVAFHSLGCVVSDVHIFTVLSCDAEAM